MLQTLEREEQQHEAQLAGLRAAIDEADASGIANTMYSHASVKRFIFLCLNRLCARCVSPVLPRPIC
jgi:hypothetical protein